MQRRRFLTGLGSAGAITTAGCRAVAGGQSLTEPTVTTDSVGRRALVFSQDGDEVGHVGVSGHVDAGVIDLSTEIWHRGGTRVDAIELRLWMPQAGQTPAEVAVVSPVEGDSSPPDVTLSTPDRKPGPTVSITVVEDDYDATLETTVSGGETYVRREFVEADRGDIVTLAARLGDSGDPTTFEVLPAGGEDNARPEIARLVVQNAVEASADWTAERGKQ